jgi:hypothetical protein
MLHVEAVAVRTPYSRPMTLQIDIYGFNSLSTSPTAWPCQVACCIFEIILSMPSHPWLALPTSQSHGKGLLPILEHRIPVACAWPIYQLHAVA